VTCTKHRPCFIGHDCPFVTKLINIQLCKIRNRL